VRRLATIAVALVGLIAISSCAALASGDAAPAPGATKSARATAGEQAERAAPKGAHTIFMINRTEKTIWPAAWPGSISGQTGWKLPPGGGTSFTVPAGWNARLCAPDRGSRRPRPSEVRPGRLVATRAGCPPATRRPGRGRFAGKTPRVREEVRLPSSPG